MPETSRSEAPAEAYDAIFNDGAQYVRHYTATWYYPMFQECLEQTVAQGARGVLEVGCGAGAFAHMLLDHTDITYQGFDFNTVAIGHARRRLGREDLFSHGDALDKGMYTGTFDCILCTEVLEHIERDIDVIRNWPPGINCVCSVPNFDDPTHVRLFVDEAEIIARYGNVIDITRIVRVARPLFLGRSLATYLQQLRWSYDKPNKLLAHFGIGTFKHLGGWFVFSGHRRE